MTTCGDVQALSPEGALGLLSGGDRAAVLDHLDTCEDCRELMHELTTVADSLVLLAPNAEPSSGFEQRVLERIDATRRRRRWPIVVAAAARCSSSLDSPSAVFATTAPRPSAS